MTESEVELFALFFVVFCIGMYASRLLRINCENRGSKGNKVPPKGSRPNPVTKSAPLTVEIRTTKNTEEFHKRINRLKGNSFPKEKVDSFRHAFEPDKELIKLQNRLAEGLIEKIVEDNPLRQFMEEEPPLNKEPFSQEHVYYSRPTTNEDYIKNVLGYTLKTEDSISKTYTNDDDTHRLTIFKKEEPKMKIYHTETQEDYNALMVELEKEGVTWSFVGNKPTASDLWGIHGNETCVKKEGNEITYSTCSYFNGYKIEKYKANDTVNNPSHYNTGGIETLDYIKAKVKDYPSYAVGNIMKYITRYEHKNGIEDLKKAQFYLNDLIEWMEGEGK